MINICIYDFPSNREKSMTYNEKNIDKDILNRAKNAPYSFLYH